MERKFDRKPSPPDDRDYRLSAYIEPHAGASPAPDSYADKTVREIAKEGVTWSLWLRIWALVKSLVHPSPAPSPPPPAPAAGAVVWPDPDQLDQERTGHCVGFGNTDFENCAPIEDHKTDADAHALYYRAKTIELGRNVPNYQPPGSGPADVEDGAYVRDGLKVLAADGRIGTYARASSMTDIIAWIRSKGPVVVGTQWLADMENPDSRGLVSVSGQDLGGHCWLVNGHIPAGAKTPEGNTFDVAVFRAQNSWGKGWGVGGSFYIKVAELERLLQDQGEAWATVENALTGDADA